MAIEKTAVTHTFRASTGLKQYQAVVNSGANNRLINPTTEGNCIGILVSSGTTGSTGRAGSTDSGASQTVALLNGSGALKIIAGTTTIDAGDFLKADTDGRASTASSTSYRFGIALDAVASTSTSAQIISFLPFPSINSFA